ncbi:hypothetical protein KSP40_PGU001266 [Platanthera guangdongensis]|uniref:Ataxin 2 SM domain-containing protein n=1 Tax=Platanthera guangdongensis TaxID=2320717 RepID=A0ABR2LXY0_9ASPA
MHSKPKSTCNPEQEPDSQEHAKRIGRCGESKSGSTRRQRRELSDHVVEGSKPRIPRTRQEEGGTREGGGRQQEELACDATPWVMARWKGQPEEDHDKCSPGKRTAMVALDQEALVPLLLPGLDEVGSSGASNKKKRSHGKRRRLKLWFEGIQSRTSSNGFNRRRFDRDNGARMENKMAPPGNTVNGGKAVPATSFSRDRLLYVSSCLIGLHVEVHVKNGSVFSGIFCSVNAKDFGIVLKMAQIIKDGSIRGQKGTPETLKRPQTVIIPPRELVQIIAKDVPLTSEEFSSANAREGKKEFMIDSVISRSHSVDVERELERWTPDADDPECPELDNIFDGTWNRCIEPGPMQQTQQPLPLQQPELSPTPVPAQAIIATPATVSSLITATSTLFHSEHTDFPAADIPYSENLTDAQVEGQILSIDEVINQMIEELSSKEPLFSATEEQLSTPVKSPT